jgi:hypothetical protein
MVSSSISRLAASAVTVVSVLGLGGLGAAGTGIASAAVRPASPPRVRGTASPDGKVGGHGYQHSRSRTNRCATYAIGVNDLGKGNLQVQAQIVSRKGRFSSGGGSIFVQQTSPTITNQSKSFNFGGGKIWTSPIIKFHVKHQHRTVEVGFNEFLRFPHSGTCLSAGPVEVTFKAA